jgi:hypothetical protein
MLVMSYTGRIDTSAWYEYTEESFWLSHLSIPEVLIDSRLLLESGG